MKRRTPRGWAGGGAALVFLTALVLVSLTPWLAGEGQPARATPTRETTWATTPLPLIEGLLPSPEATAQSTPTPTVTPEPTETPVGQWALEVVPPPWPVNCDNEWAWDGYRVPDFDGYCVPGILSRRTLNIQFPSEFYGVLSSYGPYAMEFMEDRAGVRRGTGVALTTCGMMGYTVWLRIPGEAWRGPFTVVDCGAPAHTFYQVAIQGLVAEVGYTVGQTWHPAAARVDVRIGSYPSANWNGNCLASWWVHEALAWEDGYGLLQHNITRTDGTIEAWPPLE